MRMDFNLKALCLVSNQYLYGIQYINNMICLNSYLSTYQMDSITHSSATPRWTLSSATAAPGRTRGCPASTVSTWRTTSCRWSARTASGGPREGSQLGAASIVRPEIPDLMHCLKVWMVKPWEPWILVKFQPNIVRSAISLNHFAQSSQRITRNTRTTQNTAFVHAAKLKKSNNITWRKSGA